MSIDHQKQGRLYQNGILVANAETPSQGLHRFFYWIKTIRNNLKGSDKIVWMIAHNAYNFDGPVLINNFLQHGVASITEIGRTITGFRDSLESFRKSFNYPHNTLGFLLLEFKIRQHQSLDALEDARDLKKLIEAACNKKNLSLYHFIPEFVYPRDIGR